MSCFDRCVVVFVFFFVSTLPGATTTTSARPADCRTTTGETDTAAADVAGAEHGGVPVERKQELAWTHRTYGGCRGGLW